MKMTLVAAAALVWIGTPASAHRLDEYLQATTISLETERVQAQIRLTPGVAVFPFVLGAIDTDGNGVLSAAEQRAYAARVLRDLSLWVDGDRLPLRLVSTKFPDIEEMKEGRGEIQIEFTADVQCSSRNRKLVFENHHESGIGAYLVNSLVPRDPSIRVTGQNRNYQQSFYELDYEQGGVRRSGGAVSLSLFALALMARFAMLWRAQGPRKKPV